MRSRRFEVLAFCAMLLAAAALFVSLQSNSRASSAPAAVNAQQVDDNSSTFNYQGYLINPDGSPLSGSHEVTLTIYDTVTGVGETLQHSEVFTDVVVNDGLFNVVLGDKTPLPPDFGSAARMYIGVQVDGSAELINRQRIHPVPWALLADAATTLVPGASVKSAVLNDSTLNGETKFNGNIIGSTNINGNLTVNDLPPILVKKYRDIIIPTSTYFGKSLSTGISANDYTCTMGGWQVEMDINETGSGLWSRWLFVAGANSDWRVRFTSKTHSSTPDPPVSFDLICFRNEIVSYQEIDDTAAASEVTSDNAITDPISSPEEVGQGQ